MKITITLDFGDNELAAPPDIKIAHSVEKRASHLWFDPDMREVIAGALAPLLSQLHMSERCISDIVTDIYTAPVLFNKHGKDGYRYCGAEGRLKHCSEMQSPESRKEKSD